jgi:hypothetical protein
MKKVKESWTDCITPIAYNASAPRTRAIIPNMIVIGPYATKRGVAAPRDVVAVVGYEDDVGYEELGGTVEPPVLVSVEVAFVSSALAYIDPKAQSM